MKKIHHAIILFVLLCAIFSAGLGHAADRALFTAAERQWLNTHPALSVVVNSDPPPVSIWADPSSKSLRPGPPAFSGNDGPRSMPPGEQGAWPPPDPLHPPVSSNLPLKPVAEYEQHYFQGLAADYLNEVAEVTGVSFSVDYVSENNFNAVHSALTESALDLVPTVMADQPGASSLHLSAPYIRIPIVVVMRRDAACPEDLAQLNRMKVASIFPMRPKMSGLGLTADVQYIRPEQALQDVASGKFDAFVADASLVASLLRHAPMAGVKTVGALPAALEFRLAVSPRIKDFLPIFDKAIAAIPRQKHASLWRRWFGDGMQIHALPMLSGSPESNRNADGPTSPPAALASPASIAFSSATAPAAPVAPPGASDLAGSAVPAVPDMPDAAAVPDVSSVPEVVPSSLSSTGSTGRWWPAAGWGGFILFCGGAGVLYHRGRYSSRRHGMAHLGPHLLCVHVDRDLAITDVTEALCAATGYTEPELVGKPLKTLGFPARKDNRNRRYPFVTVQRNGAWRGEVKLIKKDGFAFWTDVVITPLRRKTDITGYTLIYHDASKRKHYENLAIRDELTGLFNRRYFNTAAPVFLNRASREKKYFCLLLLDIDNFKKYNDHYGHPAGDKVLATVGKCLKQALPGEDDQVFRLGGEEFGVLSLLTSGTQVSAVAEKILTTVRRLNIEHSHNPPGILTVSIGAHTFDAKENLSIEDIYKRADEKLYLAKEQGRNRSILSGLGETPGVGAGSGIHAGL